MKISASIARAEVVFGLKRGIYSGTSIAALIPTRDFDARCEFFAHSTEFDGIHLRMLPPRTCCRQEVGRRGWHCAVALTARSTSRVPARSQRDAGSTLQEICSNAARCNRV